MKELSSLRTKIDQLDKQLWDIITQRVNTAREIGEWKRANGEQVLHSSSVSTSFISRGTNVMSYDGLLYTTSLPLRSYICPRAG